MQNSFSVNAAEKEPTIEDIILTAEAFGVESGMAGAFDIEAVQYLAGENDLGDEQYEGTEDVSNEGTRSESRDDDCGFDDDLLDESAYENKKQPVKKEKPVEKVVGFADYMTGISAIPLLSAEEEKRLGNIIREGGEDALEARNRLVESNLRLVIFCAKKFVGKASIEELNSMGYEGLIKAAEKFDPAMDCRFSTYAMWWIKQAITRSFGSELEPIRIPVHVRENIRKVRKASSEIFRESGREATPAELVQYSGLTMNEVRSAIDNSFAVLSLNAPTGDEEDTEFGDFQVNPDAVDPEEAAMKSSLKDAVREVLLKLPPKEARVLALRYGIGTDHPMTLEEIANLPEFGVTRERIRQLEMKAQRHIRQNPKFVRMLRDFVA